MKRLVPVGVGLLLAAVPLLAQEDQERKVPKDSALVSIQGCAKGRTFIVAERSEHRPTTSDIDPGRRFRLSGPKDILKDIEARERTMIEITGLVRKSQLAGPGGIAIAGGRVRIGGAMPRSPINDPARDPAYNQAVIDVESFRLLPDECPKR
jgi:hypothetical protein